MRPGPVIWRCGSAIPDLEFAQVTLRQRASPLRNLPGGRVGSISRRNEPWVLKKSPRLPGEIQRKPDPSSFRAVCCPRFRKPASREIFRLVFAMTPHPFAKGMSWDRITKGTKEKATRPALSKSPTQSQTRAGVGHPRSKLWIFGSHSLHGNRGETPLWRHWQSHHRAMWSCWQVASLCVGVRHGRYSSTQDHAEKLAAPC
jgi:hypothetical protein